MSWYNIWFFSHEREQNLDVTFFFKDVPVFKIKWRIVFREKLGILLGNFGICASCVT